MAQAVSEPFPVGVKSRRWRPNMRLWGPIGLLIAGSAVYSAICEWRDSHGLLINTSESLPNWAFVIHKTTRPERGQYVFFVPPAHPLVVRHFGANKQMFGKIIYGMPGDIVSHRGAEVLVNGKVVARMKPRTRLGEPLAAGPVGVIPPQCYFVGTPHKDGFDSRYAAIGYACAGKIVGVGEAIL